MPKQPNGQDPEEKLARCRRMYRKQQDGLPARAIVYAHMEQEGVSESTAWRDWQVVRQWNRGDWDEEKESLVSRLQTLRFKTIERCLRKGQLQTAAILMAQLGATVQETEPEGGSSSAPQLNITIEKASDVNIQGDEKA